MAAKVRAVIPRVFALCRVGKASDLVERAVPAASGRLLWPTIVSLNRGQSFPEKTTITAKSRNSFHNPHQTLSCHTGQQNDLSGWSRLASINLSIANLCIQESKFGSTLSVACTANIVGFDVLLLPHPSLHEAADMVRTHSSG